MSVADYLDDRQVVFLKSETKMEALEELVESLSFGGRLKDREAFQRAVEEREKVASTGIGLGVAVPHAKLAGYDEFFIAVGVKDGEGIDWGAFDGMPVHLIFMIGGPDNRQTEYLDVLSRLTVATKDGERRRMALKATSAQQVISLFRGC